MLIAFFRGFDYGERLVDGLRIDISTRVNQIFRDNRLLQRNSCCQRCLSSSITPIDISASSNQIGYELDQGCLWRLLNGIHQDIVRQIINQLFIPDHHLHDRGAPGAHSSIEM